MNYLISIGILILIVGCSQINKELGLEDDNVYEEAMEDVIKGRTGQDVDLSPATPEKK